VSGAGPTYPHPNPAPGSNAIGQFVIGVSPIGTIPAFDPWATVISQYGNSDRIDALITTLNEALDLTEDFDNFYDYIWNVATAQGAGLDIWGRIVGVTRTLQLPSGTNQFLGFDEPGDPAEVGFNQAPFFTGTVLTSNVQLDDADFRNLILAKAASNICDGSILATNAILLALFPHRGDAYVVDNQNMTMELKFAFALTPVEQAIVETAGVLPRPNGVLVTVVTP